MGGTERRNKVPASTVRCPVAVVPIVGDPQAQWSTAVVPVVLYFRSMLCGISTETVVASALVAEDSEP